MVVLSVAAILLAVAVPSFRTFVQNSKLDNAADTFLAALQQARSEAITRGDPVLLCRTGDSSTESCNAAEPDGSPNQANDWTPGWLMYVKEGYDDDFGVGGSYTGAAGETLLKLGQPAPDGVTITSSVWGNEVLAFFADGTLNEGDDVEYAVCDDRGARPDISQMVVIRPIGRPYLRDFDASDTCSP